MTIVSCNRRRGYPDALTGSAQALRLALSFSDFRFFRLPGVDAEQVRQTASQPPRGQSVSMSRSLVDASTPHFVD